MTSFDTHFAALQLELDWLEQVIGGQLDQYLSPEPQECDVSSWPAPALPAASALAGLVRDWRLQPAERLALVLALAPLLRPQALDMLLLESSQTGRVLTEFGGVQEARQRGFLPSGQTLAFLLSANRPRA